MPAIDLSWLGWVSLAVHGLGVFSAVAVIRAGDHRSRGAVAWVLALLALPWVAVPMYWLSGQVRYRDFARSQERTLDQLQLALTDVRTQRRDQASGYEPGPRNLSAILDAFSDLGPARQPQPTLIQRSERVFPEMEAAIDEAQHYVLLQTYLIRNDGAGKRIAAALIAAAERGCSVYLLFDELGSHSLGGDFIEPLHSAGINVLGFTSKRRLLPRIRANFRNHRKLLVVDGDVGFLGGLNIGDEYIDGADEFADWRDTHMRLDGPAALDLQLVFLKDWQFASKHSDILERCPLRWQVSSPVADDPSATIWTCALGPHERVHTGDILFNELIGAATERLWIASPYFVPDDRIIASLKGAAMRGIEVKVLVPRESDHRIFKRVHRDLSDELDAYGIEMRFYEPGFMHQKVMLIDSNLASIGSANFDNRSMRLNFEVMAVVHDPGYAKAVECMLETDFGQSTAIGVATDWGGSWYDAFATKAVRLLSPAL